MRATYANVASTLALVLALGGTGAYAAGKVTGKDIKNSSVTGQDVKDGSLAGADVAPGSLGADRLAPAVQSALAPKPVPREATLVDVPVAPVGIDVRQAIGTFGGLSLAATCGGRSGQGETQEGVTLGVVSSGARGFTTFRYFNTAGSIYQDGSAAYPADGGGYVPLVPITNLGTWAFASTDFTLTGPGGTQTGSLTLSYLSSGCRIRGWILHG